MFYWPALLQLVNILMAGQLRALRLIHPVPVAAKDVGKLESIRMLRIPRKPETDEEDGIEGETQVLNAARNEQVHDGTNVWRETAFSQASRPQHNFVVRCEEGGGEYPTTTLELSRK
jgi:hypothetical protein